MYVYVAIVPLRYEVMAVAETEDQAVGLATARALQFLEEAGAVTPETDTAEKVRDYFGVSITALAVGTAKVMG
ncbi:hypothetical protein SEA_CHARM_75 [Mycobacterium phage Charm]|nr:hypothetical protein SEA_CHARM_75 [Mycobacterium phage Charm]